MTIPVIYSVVKANPNSQFTLLTQDVLAPIFVNRPLNLDLIGINIRGAEKSLSGVIRFAGKISKDNYDVVLDLHDVIRTFIIRLFFRFKGKKVYIIDKARKERARLTSRTRKVFKPLPLVTDRYADVFRTAGFIYIESFRTLFDKQSPDLSKTEELTGKKYGKWIGIAPFAKHRGKIYSIDKMKQIVATLSEKENVSVFLFGAKGHESSVLEQWAILYSNVKNVAGRLSLNDELALISQLDIMVSMDSANMHFASLVETPVVSIWGATHPYAGFYGYHQKPENAIQLDLECRPCSVYGKKKCFRKDWACMTQLPHEKIYLKIEEVVK